MKSQLTPPTGSPQIFDIAETFFSTTDPRGIITAGNNVFCRTSGYALQELVGQPHNVIRHPNMPRYVFRVLWDTLRAKQTFMGYVKNHARNGNHYWVFAVIVPIAEGFLSVRIKPTSAFLAQIEAVYRDLAQHEAAALSAGNSEREALDGCRDLLCSQLRKLGFPTYDAFSQEALNAEIKSRDAEIARRGLRLFPETIKPASDNARRTLGPLFTQTQKTYGLIDEIYASLDSFTEISRGIREKQAAVQSITEDFRLNALNAHIAAHPLGSEGVTLGTVAQILNGYGQTMSRNVNTLADGILGTTSALAAVTSNLSAARIQIEMLLSFVAEIAEAQADDAELTRLRAMADSLLRGFSSTIQRAFDALNAIQLSLPKVLVTKEQLRKDIVYLQVAQTTGLVEVSRLRDCEGLQATFTGLRDQIGTGKRELEQLDDVVDQLKRLTSSTPATVRLVETSLAQMRDTALAVPSSPTAPVSSVGAPYPPRPGTRTPGSDRGRTASDFEAAEMSRVTG